ncbi:MAG: YidC/Oxa1 family membrane protein insertase, partial [Patescibacteria group bacterium]
MIQLFNIILVNPLFNFLVYIYDIIGDIGIAIIILTLIVKIILFPLTKKSIKSQRELQILQPKIKEIQEKYKKDKQQMTQEMLKMYKKHKVNPLGGCLPILIQLPILLALYQVFRKGFDSSSLDFLYSFISNPGIINPFFLNIVNLAETSLILAIIAAAAQYFQGYFMQVKMKLLPVQ